MAKPVRTSLTHPLQIAELAVPGTRGMLGLTFCPGKKQLNAITGVWNRDLQLDLGVVKAWGASGVLTLTEQHELQELQVPDLGTAVTALGMDWWHLPIEDQGVPDDEFQRRWEAGIGPAIRTRLANGDRLLIHCMGGLGRTGLLASQILIEFGAAPLAAIAQTRAARPGAIENEAQERYLLAAKPLPPPTTIAADGAFMPMPVYLIGKIARHGAAIQRLAFELESNTGEFANKTSSDAIAFDAADFVWAYLVHTGNETAQESRYIRNALAQAIASELQKFLAE